LLRLIRKILAALIVLTMALWTSGAWAVLGQVWIPSATTAPSTTSTPSNPQVALRAISAATPTLYSAHSTLLETGTSVQEYSNSAGVVFAISWKGPVMPDLSTLLGTYFSHFDQAARASRSSRNIGTPLIIENPDLVVQSSGHMRSFSGNAYVPGLIPAGLNIHDILP